MAWKLEIGLPSPDIKNFLRSLKKAEKGLEKIDKVSKKTDKGVESLGTSFFTANKGVALLGVGLLTVNAILNKTTKSFAELENRMIAIGRISGLSDSGIGVLETSFRSLAVQTGLSAVAIANFAEQGARFGIRGVEELKDFTTSMALLGSITGNVSVSMVKDLSRIKELTDDTGVSFANLSNAIVELGNNFATSEDKIARTTTRISTDLSQFDVSTSFVLGVGTAMDSMGISAERGGSAMARMSRALQVASAQGGKAMQELSQTTGIARRELDRMVELNPAEAIIKIAETGADVNIVMKSLGLNAIRTTQVFATLSKNSTQLTKAMRIASGAITETSSLMNHQTIQAESLLNIQKRLNQSAKEIGTLIGKETGDLAKDYLKTLLLVTQSFNNTRKEQGDQLNGWKLFGDVTRKNLAGLAEVRNMITAGLAGGLNVVLGLASSTLLVIEDIGSALGADAFVKWLDDMAGGAARAEQEQSKLNLSFAETAKFVKENVARIKKNQEAELAASKKLAEINKFKLEQESRAVDDSKRQTANYEKNGKLLETQLATIRKISIESNQAITLGNQSETQASLTQLSFDFIEASQAFGQEVVKGLAAAADRGDQAAEEELLKELVKQTARLREIKEQGEKAILDQVGDQSKDDIESFQSDRSDFADALSKFKQGPVEASTSAITDEAEAVTFAANVKRQNALDERRYKEQRKQLEAQRKELEKTRLAAQDSLKALKALAGQVYSGV